MNNIADLESFLRSKATGIPQIASEPKSDWVARKNRWLRNIHRLYEQVKGWLGALQKEGLLSYEIGSVELREDPIGSYKAEVLDIIVGDQRISFQPKGAMIVGAEGRIDVRGPQGIRTIIFDGEGWYLVQRSARPLVVEFDQESFQRILEEVMD